MLRLLRKLLGGGQSLPAESIVCLHALQGYDGPLDVCDIKHIHITSAIRLGDGRYRLNLPGTSCILVSRPLAKVLRRTCGHCAEFLVATVADAHIARTLAKCVEVRPRDEITPDTLPHLVATGAHVWHWEHRCLCVTKQVMVEIQRARIAGLSFRPFTLCRA
ncbi:MAG: hypothetical protein ACHRHE_20450 [Tepidisphaerales bacterium]